ncbi:Calx-beta domain-containing protein [Kordia sp.]|uniref:Calx-beta domain-containing protein n=1 Tax=Kordia sp. TaxID=1965332 RepID=UPI003B5B10A6
MKKSLLSLLCLLLLCTFSCENDDNVLPEVTAEEEQPVTPINFEENFGSMVSARFLGRVINEQNEPVEGATIRIGNTVATTDIFGIFSVSDATAFEKFAYITAEKSGYIEGSRALIPSTTDVNRVEIMLLKEDVIATVNSGENSTVNLPNGTSVTFEGNFITSSGAAHNGEVQVIVKHLSPDDENMEAMMPGMLFAQDASGDAVTLETYGMLAVELQSMSGQELQLAEGSSSQISLPVASNTINPPATVPLWHFDQEQGYWIEEGEATLQGDRYVGNVSHFSFWNIDIPYDTVTLCITLVDESGAPLPYTWLQLQTELLNAAGTYGYTNSSGQECGLVPSGVELNVTVPGSSCANEPFTTTIGPYTSDTNITITVSSNQNSTTLSGVFMTCDGNDVTDGYIQLFINGNSEIIPVTDGTINYTINYCGTIAYSVKGIDVANNEVTEVFEGTLSGETTLDLGTLSSCTGLVDSDGDGIFDSFEDVNGDNDLTNDDTDQDGVPNYLDADDDGDGVNTADEDYDGDGDPRNDDSDGDQIPDYLDSQDVVVFSVEALGVDCDPVLFDLDAIISDYGNDLHTYAFYLTQADAAAGTGQLSSPFAVSIADLTSNTQMIFVTATNIASGQSAIGTVYLYWSYEDTDGDGLTDCEELTGVDNPSTVRVPDGTSDPNDPLDPLPVNTTVAVSGPSSVMEDVGTFTVNVELETPSSIETTVEVSIAADNNNDFTNTSNILTYLPGETTPTAPLEFTVIDDAIAEGTETLLIQAAITSGNSNGSSNNVFIMNIVDNDNDAGLPTITLSGGVVNEADGTASVTLSIDQTSTEDIVVFLQTTDQTATAPDDYVTTAASVTIPAGSLSIDFIIPIVDDTTVEQDEFFFISGDVTSGSTTNGNVLSEVVITDDDTAQYPTQGEINACADPSTGTALIDLTSMNDYFSNGPNGFTFISYHLTEADALANTNALSSPYEVADNVTLYVRIADDTLTLQQVSLLYCTVNVTPNAPTGLSLTACDGDADGTATFQLTQLTPDIVQANASLVVSFYETEQDAFIDVNQLIPSYTNINPNVQVIYFRVEDPATGCFSVGSIELIVDSSC